MLAGLGLAKLMRSPEHLKRNLIRLTILNAIIAVAAIVSALFLKDHLPTGLPADLAAAGIALGVGTALALLTLRLPWPYLPPAAIALGSLLMMAALMKVRSDAASLYSYRELAESIRPLLGPECILASYHHQIQALPFYTERREVLVGYRGELAPFGDSAGAAATFITTDKQLSSLWSSAACVVLIANRGDLPHLQGLLHPLAITGCEGKKFALVNWPSSSAFAVQGCGNAHR
jgi:hypothetical protein